jgi:hypothetical protein
MSKVRCITNIQTMCDVQCDGSEIQSMSDGADKLSSKYTVNGSEYASSASLKVGSS